MKYGDFSSLVQLGVGLHVGTALLQLYGEIGEAPFVRIISRINRLFSQQEPPPDDIQEELSDLEGRFEIFRIRFFNEYKKYVKANALVALLLTVALIVISYRAEDQISLFISVLFAALSTLPAPITLAALWLDADREIRPLKERAAGLETRLLGGRNVQKK